MVVRLAVVFLTRGLKKYQIDEGEVIGLACAVLSKHWNQGFATDLHTTFICSHWKSDFHEASPFAYFWNAATIRRIVSSASTARK